MRRVLTTRTTLALSAALRLCSTQEGEQQQQAPNRGTRRLKRSERRPTHALKLRNEPHRQVTGAKHPFRSSPPQHRVLQDFNVDIVLKHLREYLTPEALETASPTQFILWSKFMTKYQSFDIPMENALMYWRSVNKHFQAKLNEPTEESIKAKKIQIGRIFVDATTQVKGTSDEIDEAKSRVAKLVLENLGMFDVSIELLTQMMTNKDTNVVRAAGNALYTNLGLLPTRSVRVLLKHVQSPSNTLTNITQKTVISRFVDVQKKKSAEGSLTPQMIEGGAKRKSTNNVVKELCFLLTKMNSANFVGYSMANVMGVLDLLIAEVMANNEAYLKNNLSVRSMPNLAKVPNDPNRIDTSLMSFMTRMEAVGGFNNNDEVFTVLEVLAKIKLTDAHINALAEVFCIGLVRTTPLSSMERLFMLLHGLQVSTVPVLQALVNRVMLEAKATSKQGPISGTEEAWEAHMHFTAMDSSKYLALMTRVMRVLGHHPKHSQELNLVRFLQLASHTYSHTKHLTDGQMILIAENVHLLARSFSPDAPLLEKLRDAVDKFGSDFAVRMKFGTVSPHNADRMLEFGNLLEIRKCPGMVRLREAREEMHIDADNECLQHYPRKLPVSVTHIIEHVERAQQVCNLSSGGAFEVSKGPKDAADTASTLAVLKEVDRVCERSSVYNILTAVHIMRMVQNGGVLQIRGIDYSTVYLADGDKNWKQRVEPSAIHEEKNADAFRMNSAVQVSMLHMMNKKLSAVARLDEKRDASSAELEDEAANHSKSRKCQILFGCKPEKLTAKRVEAMFIMVRNTPLRRLRDNYQLHKQLHSFVEEYCNDDRSLVKRSEAALASALL